MPISDYTTAAETIANFLKLLNTSGHLRLRYRITAGPGAADPDGFEAREIYVELSGPDASLVTAHNGELLRALEHVVAKMIRLESDEHDRISFDAENFKAIRARELKLSAETAAKRVRHSNEPFAFSPMSSRERRLLHLAFRGYDDIETASVGQGPDRALVAFPKGYDREAYERAHPPVSRPPTSTRRR